MTLLRMTKDIDQFGTAKTKKSITFAQYLSLEGLATLRNQHVAALRSIGEAIEEIVQENYDLGHVGDFTWTDDMTVKELLNKLSMTIDKRPKPTKTK